MNAKADLVATSPLLPHPPMFKHYPVKLALHMATTDMRASQSQLDSFREFAHQGDALADALVLEMRNLPGRKGRRQFEQALNHGLHSIPDAPPALREFFNAVEAPPYWLDTDKLKLGAETIQRTGLAGAYGALVDVSLMGGYLARRALKVLVRTGEIGGKAPRRIAETALWWMSVTDTDGLDRFADGFKNTLRVRITHAQIRAAMNNHPEWNYADWDSPVNQPQMAGTQLLFSLIGLLGMRVMGFRFSAQEIDAVIHLWRYVGHLIGVHPDLIPASEDDAWRLMWLLAATEFQPDGDSQLLAQALREALPPLHGVDGDSRISKLAASAVKNYHSALSRLVLGSENAEALGLENHPLFTAAVIGASALNFGLESVRKAIPGATRLSVRFGRSSRRYAINRLAPPLKPNMTFARD